MTALADWGKPKGTIQASKFDKDREPIVKRLTPLWYDHIRLTGRYEFTLTAKREVGGLRPLQQKQR